MDNSILLILGLAPLCSMVSLYLIERFSRMAILENQLEVLVFEERLSLQSCYRIVERFWSILPARCASCSTTHRPWHFLSLLSLRHRCRSIPIKDSLLAESFFVASLALFASKYGSSPGVSLLALYLISFVVITVIDFRYYIIPDEINFIGVVWGLAFSAYITLTNKFAVFSPLPDVGFVDSVQGMLVGAGVLYALGSIASQLLNRDAMGGGDIKLCAFFGACFGLEATLLCLALASILGSIFGVFSMLKAKVIEHSKGYTMIAFGPYIIISMIIVLYYGPQQLIHSYQDFSQRLFKEYLLF